MRGISLTCEGSDITFQIYVVSLKEDVARRNKLANQFLRWFSSMVICDAVNGKTLPAEQYFDLVKHSYVKYCRIMTPSEVGCALSHKKAWENFLDSQAKYAIILEDDVIGKDEDMEEVLRLLVMIDKQIGPYIVWVCGGMDGLPRDKVLCRRTSVPGVFEVPIFSRKYVYRTVSYVISRESAQILLMKQTRDLHLADDWARLLERSKLKLLYSEIFHHPVERAASRIEKERASVQNSYQRSKKLGGPLKKALSKTYHNARALGALLLGYRKLSFVVSDEKKHTQNE